MSEADSSKAPRPFSRIQDELLNLWSTALLIGVVTGLGLSPALKGSRSGLDFWIDRADLLGAVATQFAAITTWLVLVQLGLQCARSESAGWARWPVLLLSTLPSVGLMAAQQSPLPQGLAWIVTAAAGLSLLVASFVRRKQSSALTLALALGAISLGVELYGLGAARRSSNHLLDARLGLSVLTSGLAFVLFVRTQRSATVPVWIGVVGLLFLISERASGEHVHTGALLLGRTLRAIVPDQARAASGWASSLGLCLALVTSVCALVGRWFAPRPGDDVILLVSLVALSLALASCPVSWGALTLLALATLLSKSPGPKAG